MNFLEVPSASLYQQFKTLSWVTMHGAPQALAGWRGPAFGSCSQPRVLGSVG